VENILFVDTELSSLLQVVCENVEEELGVRVGVDVSVGIGIKELSQGWGVDEVTVLYVSSLPRMETQSTHVRKNDTIWRVDIERLSFCVRRATSSRVSDYKAISENALPLGESDSPCPTPIQPFSPATLWLSKTSWTIPLAFTW